MAHKIGVGGFETSKLAKRYVLDVLDTNRLGYGPYSKKFEREFAAAHGSRFGVLSNSGTSSLQVALQCLYEVHAWENGDEVIVPATTFVATSNIVRQCGMTPVLVDVETNYYGLDPEKLEAVITPRTKCIIPVHLFGQPCDMDPILAIARAHKLKIIEDSCETMFSTYNGKKVGSLGDIGCFSLYVAHVIVAGVGGVSTTSNPEYARIMRSLVNHGRNGIYVSIDDDIGAASISEVIAKRFQFERVGFSYRITEMEAALALAGLEEAPQTLVRRLEIAEQYNKAFKDFGEWIQTPAVRDGSTHCYMMYPILCSSGSLKRELVLHLETEQPQIETREMLPLINQPINKDIAPNPYKFPKAFRILGQGFYIGCHPYMTPDQVDTVISRIQSFLRNLSE